MPDFFKSFSFLQMLFKDDSLNEWQLLEISFKMLQFYFLSSWPLTMQQTNLNMFDNLNDNVIIYQTGYDKTILHVNNWQK